VGDRFGFAGAIFFQAGFNASLVRGGNWQLFVGYGLGWFGGAHAFGGFAFPLGRFLPEANQVRLQLCAFALGESRHGLLQLEDIHERTLEDFDQTGTGRQLFENFRSDALHLCE
jgi:hypothetical protein